jgi:carbonic anhydrase/acetyltransferase-like protein (isoleucine patch superfamily)
MAIYELEGVRPTIGDHVFVAPSASVIGDVVIGESSSIWFGVVVRGDVFPIRIGARTNIQDNSVVHVTGGKTSTTIGDDVTVGHSAIVHGCKVGNRCLVGMGSIVLDGVVIEDECLIAAGSLVPPGMHVPSRSMVMGRPGKVIRTLRADELESIDHAARDYVRGARAFISALRVT